MVTPVQTDYQRYYEGLTTLEMINLVQARLGVAANDYNRYTKAQIIQALNMGQERFAKLTACLLYPVVIIGKANRQAYRMPFGALRITAARYYTGTAETDYYELDVLRDMRQMQRLDNTFRGTTGTPEYCFPSYRAGNIWLVGFSPIPSSDGLAWSGDDYGVVTAATGFTVAGNITGSHKTGYPNSAFLVDSAGRNLVTLGALVGYPVFNMTKGSSGLITAIGDQDATNDKITVTLSSGDWDESDTFEIPMGEYGTILDGDQVSTFVSSYLGTVGDISGNTGNFVLDVARKPLSFSATLDDMYCEIPANYQEAVVHYAVYWLGSGQYKGTAQAEKAGDSLQQFMSYVAEYNGEDNLVQVSQNEIEDLYALE